LQADSVRKTKQGRKGDGQPPADPTITALTVVSPFSGGHSKLQHFQQAQSRAERHTSMVSMSSGIVKLSFLHATSLLIGMRRRNPNATIGRLFLGNIPFDLRVFRWDATVGFLKQSSSRR
jgi:hypothetical protein